MEACLSVVMPCYNEAATILEVTARVLRSPYTRELLIVDDGSSDETLELALSIQDPRVRVLAQPFNMGKGAALRRGLAEATSDFVIVQDADLEYDPADYEIVLEPLLAGRADVVYGSRFHNSRPHRVLYYWHSVGNALLTTASNVFTNINLTDMETCYKAFRREVLKSFEIEEDRFGFEPEITAKVATGGWRIFEVGISYSGRTYAEGKKIGWKDGVRAMYCIVRYSRPGQRVVRWRYRRPEGLPTAATEHPVDLTDTHASRIARLIAPHLGERNVALSCGHSAVVGYLTAAGHDIDVTRVLEDDPASFVLENRVARTPEPRPDTFLLINVLEHFDDDDTLMSQLRRALGESGRIILYVPAFEGLFSAYDARAGHRRRYTKRSLRRVLAHAGLEPIELTYVDAIGAIGWWLLARRLSVDPTQPRLARTYDRVVAPLSEALERTKPPRFGQALFCVATPSQRHR